MRKDKGNKERPKNKMFTQFAKCVANIDINYTIYQINRRAVAQNIYRNFDLFNRVCDLDICVTWTLMDLHEYLVFASLRAYVLLKYSFSRLQRMCIVRCKNISRESIRRKYIRSQYFNDSSCLTAANSIV